MATHDFDEEESVVAGGGVSEFIDGIECYVECGVKSYGEISAVEIVVDGPGDPDALDVRVFITEDVESVKGSVSSDDDEGVDALFLELVIGGVAPFRCEECFAACGLKDRPSVFDDA